VTFTDQKSRVATIEDLNGNWSGHPDNFRCYVCGHKFQINDIWRWVCSKQIGIPNFLVCQLCDGDNVQQQFAQQVAKAKEQLWWLLKDC